jgi:hypothetical protein
MKCLESGPWRSFALECAATSNSLSTAHRIFDSCRLARVRKMKHHEMIMALRWLLVFSMLVGCTTERHTDAELPIGQIYRPIEIVGGDAISGQVYPANLKRLRREPLALGYGPPYTPDDQPFFSKYISDRPQLDDESYENEKFETINVASLEDYRKALAEGYSAYNTFELSMESFFIRADAIEAFLNLCCVREFGANGDLNPENISVASLSWMGSDERKQIMEDTQNQLTLGDYLQAGKHSEKKHGASDVYTGLGRGMLFNWKHEGAQSWSFDHQHWTYSMEVAASGDINCDGETDFLIFRATYARGGTGRYYSNYVVLGPKNPRQNCLMPYHFFKGRLHPWDHAF